MTMCVFVCVLVPMERLEKGVRSLEVRVTGGWELCRVAGNSGPQEEQQDYLTTEPFWQPLKWHLIIAPYKDRVHSDQNVSREMACSESKCQDHEILIIKQWTMSQANLNLCTVWVSCQGAGRETWARPYRQLPCLQQEAKGAGGGALAQRQLDYHTTAGLPLEPDTNKPIA